MKAVFIAVYDLKWQNHVDYQWGINQTRLKM